MLLAGCVGPPGEVDLPTPPPDQVTSDTTLLQGRPNPYRDPRSPALRWAEDHRDDPRSAVIAARMKGSWPPATWLDGSSVAQVERVLREAAAVDAMPFLVSDALPGPRCDARDRSRGGGPAAYAAWTEDLAGAIGGSAAVVVLEPGSIALAGCLTDEQRAGRTAMLTAAVETLASSGATVLVDAGPGDGGEATGVARRLSDLLRDGVVGLAFGVGTYQETGALEEYAEQVRTALGSEAERLHLVLDVARTVPRGEDVAPLACNPSAGKVSPGSQVLGDTGYVKRLWIMAPGLSDGECGGASGVPRGAFDPDLAVTALDLDVSQRGSSEG